MMQGLAAAQLQPGQAFVPAGQRVDVEVRQSRFAIGVASPPPRKVCWKVCQAASAQNGKPEGCSPVTMRTRVRTATKCPIRKPRRAAVEFELKPVLLPNDGSLRGLHFIC